MGDERWQGLEKHWWGQVSWHGPISSFLLKCRWGLLVPLQWFLREDYGLDGHRNRRLPGFHPSSLQVHPNPQSPTNTTSGPPAPTGLFLNFYAHACPSLCRAFSLSLHKPYLIFSVSISISFSLLLLLPFSPPCHPSPAPEWVSLPSSLRDSIFLLLSSHPCTSFFVFLSPSPGLPSISLPLPGFGFPQPPHLQLSLLPLAPLPATGPFVSIFPFILRE